MLGILSEETLPSKQIFLSKAEASNDLGKGPDIQAQQYSCRRLGSLVSVPITIPASFQSF
jgi:hypothetical protein